MPDQATIERAQRDARHGKSASSQAGEFVREQIHQFREGKDGARSAKQAIAIGLSEARRAGVPVSPSKTAPAGTRRKAERELEQGQGRRGEKPSPSRSRARIKAQGKEGGRAARTRGRMKASSSS